MKAHRTLIRNADLYAKRYTEARDQGLDTQAQFWLAKYKQVCKELGTDPKL